MNAAEIQQRLDANGLYDGTIELPLGEHFLESPLFLGPTPGGKSSDFALCGRAWLNAFFCKTAIFAGVRRGLIGDDQYTPEGFRTRKATGEYCQLIVRGTEGDLGPQYRWDNVKDFLTVRFSAIRNGDRWPMGLAGIHANDMGYAPRPSPWFLLWWEPFLVFGIRTSDDVVRLYETPVGSAVKEFDVQVSLDLKTGNAFVMWGGAVPVPMKARPAPPWVPGCTLANNSMWPLSIGRADPYCNSSGYWAQDGPIGDITIREFSVTTDGNYPICRLFPKNPRPATYPGGPGLPLVPFASGGGSHNALVVRQDQGTPDSVGDVLLDGVRILHSEGAAAISLGGIMGGLRMQGVKVMGCARGVQSLGLSVEYPVTMLDTRFVDCKDVGLFLYRVWKMVVERSEINYCGRAITELLGCGGKIEGVFGAPGNGERQVAGIIQRGGDMVFTAVDLDFEWGIGFPMIQIQPCSFDQPWMGTTTRITDCYSGVTPDGKRNRVYSFLKPMPGYEQVPIVELKTIRDRGDAGVGTTAGGTGGSDARAARARFLTRRPA